ncbi:alcohol dehydrogenase catalytic domain-containing protein [Pseudonocardia sp. ICBG1293]|uniref:alcohol dehydrogenase catalytic domain-containing protein n=1 Tax=Pseudonocardia sp. ICBG1293 TaxID=2844382 RepID=UPI001CCB56CD|nr:alcohol dehydrogenase catalytic domain-containing protein [Pseudonocardia sp. ICBG1293]
MRALTYRGPLDVGVDTVPDPEPADGLGAVVRVGAAGVCGSDLHIYAGHGFSDDTGYCVGHEAVGEVVELGGDVRRFRVGDRVLLPASIGCVLCVPCARGHVAACDHRRAPWKEYCYGMSSRLPGAQAEAVAVPHADVNLVAVPDGISDDTALLLCDNAPTAWYGARRARIAPGDVVAVIGLGPVGQLAVLSAFLMGASRVLAVDPVDHRRAWAVAQGAEPVDPGDPKASIRELTGGRGCNAVVEAVGADETIALAVSAATQAGRVSRVGVSRTGAFPFRMEAAQTKELEFAIGLCSAQRELPVLVALAAAGRLAPDWLVTHRLGLSEGPAAYAVLAGRTDGVGKVVLEPSR